VSWPNFWLECDWRCQLLKPLSALVGAVAKQRLHRFQTHRPQSPGLVIVIGNIVVGGSGKTPFIHWLAKQLEQQGLRYGVISRGYGGKAKHWPQVVTADSSPGLVGDEPVLLARTLACPVVVAPKRAEALEKINQLYSLDVVISDDGLQHYALPRDIEIVLFDSERKNNGLGNGLCIPAGPLREPISRLNQVDYVVFNGQRPENGWEIKAEVGEMRLVPQGFENIKSLHSVTTDAFNGQSVYALAGIGNPSRFFQTLERLGIECECLAFDDHYAYAEADFSALDPNKPVLMTRKDAVKCQEFAKDHWWVLDIEPQCSVDFSRSLLQRICSHPKLTGHPCYES
jgi:tetraacyldisaccharide 4'-kinase